ncbi:MAG: sugar phosphate isomerase/epimerase family protein [Chloroflexota bacterium]
MSHKLKIAIVAWEFPWLSFAEICKKAHDYGLQYIDCGVPLPEDLPMYKAALDKYGLQAVVTSGSVKAGSIKMNASTQADIPELQHHFIEAIEMTAALGAPYLVSYYGGNLAYDAKASMQRYKRNMRPVMEAAEKNGVTILIETEYNQVAADVTRTADGTLDLVEFMGSDYFQVNFDPCNLYIAGEEGYPYAYEVLQPYTRHIHLKDAMKYDAARHGRKYRKVLQTDARGSWICVALGQGGMNTSGLVRRLQADKFDGVAAIELHTLPDLTEQVFDESIQFLRDLDAI